MSKKSLMILGLLAVASCSMSAVFAADAIYTDDLGRMHFLGRGGYSSVRKIQMDEAQAGVVNDAVNKYSAPSEESVFKPLDSESSKEVPAAIQQKEEAVPPADAQIQPPVKEEATAAPALRDAIQEKQTVNKAKHKSSFTFKKGTMDASNPYSYGSTNIPDKTRYEKDKEDFEAQKARFFGEPGMYREEHRSVDRGITPDRRF